MNIDSKNTVEALVKKNGKGNSPYILLFGSMLIMGIGLFLLWLFTLSPLYKVLRSRSWVTRPAVVLKSWKEPIFRGTTLQVRYEYMWKNQTMEGQQYDFFLSKFGGLGDTAIERAMKNYPAGKQTECLVNPDNPFESVLSRAIPWRSWITPPGCLLFIWIGFWGCKKAIRHMQRQSKSRRAQ
jgi:hypothetical protein